MDSCTQKHPKLLPRFLSSKYTENAFGLQCSRSPLAGFKGRVRAEGRGNGQGGKRMGEGEGCVMAVGGWTPLLSH